MLFDALFFSPFMRGLPPHHYPHKQTKAQHSNSGYVA